MWDSGVIRVLFSCFHMVLAVLFLVMLVCSLELVEVFTSNCIPSAVTNAAEKKIDEAC